MEILPFVSIGDLRFGESRQDVRKHLGTKYQVFRKDVGANETDAYDELGLHLYYDNDDKLEYVETFTPAAPTFKGVAMLGRHSEDVQEDLARAGHTCSVMDDVSINCGSAGIALYSPDEMVEGVGVYRKGYFDA